MKKIVAIVLSLVMVLGLATTAFAATTSTGSVSTTSVTPVKAAVYDLATVPGQSMYQLSTEVTKIELTTVSGKVTNDVPMYVPNVYSLTYTWDDGTTTGTATNDLFIEVAKADATYALKNNGAWVYLYNVGGTLDADRIDDLATNVVIDAKVAVTDEDIDCGDCFVYNAAAGKNVPAAYYVSGDDVYYVGGDAGFAYFNGEFVAVGEIPFTAQGGFKAHVWDATTATYRGVDDKGHNVPVAVECEDCEKEFKVVPAYMFDNTWVEFVDYQNYTTGYYVVLKAAASAPAAGETVESAKTFDAGIAMYVGMSVMAAAGSAVVLKKKD